VQRETKDIADETPKVAIGVPVRNGEKYLAAALNSIRSQTFKDFEVLISDNASTDRTREISESFCQSDSRFSYRCQQQNLGAAGNFNYVFHHTSAPFFKWAAYDDLMRPVHIEACLQALESGSTNSVLAYPQTVRIDPAGAEMGAYHRPQRRGGESPSGRLRELIGPGEHQETVLHMCFPIFGLIRRSALEKTSLIANMPRSDNLLLVELALLGVFIDVEDELFLRREHDEGSVIAAEKAAHGADIERHLAQWFDPRSGKRFPATVSRLGLGYLRAVLRTPMPPEEKIKCMRIVAGWMARHGRIIGGEAKIAVKERLGVS
jgi:hypothetical protein